MHRIYDFGEFRLNETAHQLSRGETPIMLTPKAFKTLLCLVRRAGELVGKDELINAVWEDVIVEETGLTRNISVIRKILDDVDRQNPKFIETISGLGYRFIGQVRKSDIPARLEVQRLTVLILPFVTEGLREKDIYLGNGLAEFLANHLSLFKMLIVRPVPTGVELNLEQPNEIAELYNVRFLVKSKISRFAEKYLIKFEIFDSIENRVRWLENFEVGGTDLAKISDWASIGIAQNLLPALAPNERKSVVETYKPTSDALRSYLRGRFYLSRKTPQNLWLAFEEFTNATRLDPDFALPYIGLADTYAHQHLRQPLFTHEPLLKALNWLAKSLELDPRQAEALATLGYFSYFYEWDWQKAETNFRKSLTINPNYLESHLFYANFLSRLGRFAESYEQIEYALSLNSNSFAALSLKAQNLYRSRRFDEARAETDALHELFPDEPKLFHLYSLKAMSLSLDGRHDEAFATFDEAERQTLRVSDGLREFTSAIGSAYARAGRTVEAEKTLAKLYALQNESDVSYEIAAVESNLGNFDKALELLQILCEKRDWRLVHINVDLDFFVLHEHPQFREILGRIGIIQTDSDNDSAPLVKPKSRTSGNSRKRTARQF